MKVSAITQLLRMLWQISQEFANRGGGKAPFLEKKEKRPFPFAVWRGRILNIGVRSEVSPGFFEHPRSSHPAFCAVAAYFQDVAFQTRLIFSLYYPTAIFPNEIGLWVNP